ncbi:MULTISPECIES: TIGR03621 family F420-dependent LLM class oxidoreductase [unclassified Streptomyces]|uniref:TIGR03621 family F420-dependent LLM class oxidoreductase n=1 Tax=unclassified Streptomyces TaxID=2593676 RepID=UPI00093F36F1|nr:TIGR03621 family F420-dependent LLM class oxidoreductase [Streptomyces sp. TSRI0107]OKJ89592.1 hypothetical protein AMK31_06720 [Streptomyces sp. TSRI0107]
MTETTERPFRFAVNALAHDTDWPALAREAESLGYDLIGTSDHLGMTAPFPSLVAAAAATSRIRVTTYVVNTTLWDPEVLAREIAGTDRLTGGRLEVGLHPGWSSSTATAGLTEADRLARLAKTVDVLERLLPDPEHRPRPLQRPRPPLMIVVNEPGEVELAARHADLIGVMGAGLPLGGGLRLLAPDEFARTVDGLRDRLAELGRTAELNVGAKRVVITDDRETAAEKVRIDLAPHLTASQLLDLPTVLIGTHEEIAAQLRAARARFGLSYITVFAPFLRDFAPVIPLLREG